MKGVLELKIRPYGLLTAFGAFVGSVSLLGFLGEHYWVLDLFSHFRVQYTLCLTLVAVLLWGVYNSKWGLCFGTVALVNLWTIVPLFLPTIPLPEHPNGKVYKTLQANVDRQYGDPARVMDLIEKEVPDFILLEEISEDWLNQLEKVLQDYPHSLTKPRADNFGIGFFSKHPLFEGTVSSVGDAAIPTCRALVDLPEGALTMIGTHPVPPVGWRPFQLRNQQFAALAELVADSTRATVLWGDLNATPWSFHFQKLLRSSGLRDSGRGWGHQPTWSANHPFLRIPIDHFLHSEEIWIHQRKVGTDVGSDHYPLIVHFSIESSG